MSISYAPGSWILIAGREVNVLLPESEKQRAASVWAAIDSGAGFAQALDAIVSAGLAGLSAFALVAEDGDTTRVVVRGELQIELRTNGTSTTVAGTGTWVEESLTGVTGVSVWAEPAGDQRLTIEEGLVRASGFESGAAAAAPTVVDAPAAPVLALVPDMPALVVPTLSTGYDITGIEGLQPAAADFGDEAEESLDAPEVEDEFGDSATDDFGALGILPEPDLEPEIEPEVDADPVSPGMIPPPPPAFPPPAYAPEPPQAPEPEPVTAPEPAREPLRLAFSHGDNVELTSPVVVGRAPHPDRYSHLVDPLVVRVPSPHQEISGTHVAISPNDDGVQVTDLGSTNGTLIIRGGGAPEELRPGVSVGIARGDVIDLGDSLTIRVL